MSHTVIARKRAEPEAPKKGSSITLTAHGDGTYHTTPNHWSDSDGRVDHASIGHALMHIAKEHSAGDHFHVHNTETGYTTHHVTEGGSVHGPHEHKTLGAVKKQMSKALVDEDDDEGQPAGSD